MITIYGASDDLIEIDGAIREEFAYQDIDGGDLVAFSDGTVLRIHFTDWGVWRISPVARGTAQLHIEHTTEDGDTDRATLAGDVRWVVHGIGYEPAEVTP